jgi:hypothetical protein
VTLLQPEREAVGVRLGEAQGEGVGDCMALALLQAVEEAELQ